MIKNESIRKLKRDVEAISPVIATILLVLVAVVSAVAFYAFTSAWQSEQQDNIDNVDISKKTILDISGSTTVQPLLEESAKSFLKANPSYTVNVAGGGSGKGITDVTSGVSDIGAISKSWAASDATAYPAVRSTIIAYDGVVVVTSHALTGASANAIQNLTSEHIRGVYGYDASGNKVAATYTTWGALLTALNQVNEASNPAIVDTNPIVTYQRSEDSGTEEGFAQKVLGLSKAKNVDNSGAIGVEGNSGVIAALQSDKNGIGFTSFGYAEANSLSVFGLNDVKVVTHATIKSGEYDGTRPLVLLTNGNPTGLVADFIDFILDETNNKALTEKVGYTSLY